MIIIVSVVCITAHPGNTFFEKNLKNNIIGMKTMDES